MSFIDIVVLVLVGLAVVTRFTKFKLPKDGRDKAAKGQDWGQLRRGLMPQDETKPEPKVVGEGAAPVASKPVKPAKDAGKGLEGIAKIAALEPGFSEKEFLNGAKAAYGYFYECWNRKDESGMDELCAPVLLNRVVARWQGKDWQAVTVDSLDDAKVAGARVHGKTAIVEVDFKATQREGAGVPKSVRGRWTLARALNSDDPNWELQDMKTGVDA